MPDFYDFYCWGRANEDLPKAARYEIEKLPDRLRLEEDEDLVEYDADLLVFEDEIALKGDHKFVRARDPAKAKAEANSRIRTALRQFLAAHGVSGATAPVRAKEWTILQDWVADNEGWTDKGDCFPQGRSAAVASLARQFGSAPPSGVTSAGVIAALQRIPSRKRRSFRSAARFLERLRAERETLPAAIAALMPRAPIVVSDPDKRVDWRDLPAELRRSAETVFAELLVKPETAATEALARIEAGEDPEALIDEVNRSASAGEVNEGHWRSAHQGHVSWLYRGALRRGQAPASLGELLTLANFQAAIDAHLDEARTGRVQAAVETQTFRSRFSGIIGLAAKGLKDRKLAASFAILREKYTREVRNPRVKGFSARAEAVIDTFIDAEDALYRRFVRAPELILAAVRERLEDWDQMPRNKRLEALKLAASAAAWALQLCRARRRKNLILERIKAPRDPVTRVRLHARTLTSEDGEYLSLTPKGETKTGRKLEFVVRARDAEALRAWIEEFRPLYVKERGLSDSCYLFPGAAAPRGLRPELDLPAGCASGAWFAEMWSAGAEVVGLGLTPHEMRHATATLWLRTHPGDYAGAAAILGIAESTVRKKYGADDAAPIADQARQEAYRRYAGECI